MSSISYDVFFIQNLKPVAKNCFLTMTYMLFYLPIVFTNFVYAHRLMSKSEHPTESGVAIFGRRKVVNGLDRLWSGSLFAFMDIFG